jgi:hypothetical protein
MSGKNQAPIIFNWQSANPATGFLPLKGGISGSAPSGILSGAMASTNIIYSQIIDVSRMDNIGLEVTWTGTPTGTFEVDVSCSGINFYALTFSPILAQPAGSAGGYYVNLAAAGFRYLLLKYTNTSGSGSLTVYGQQKDLN